MSQSSRVLVWGCEFSNMMSATPFIELGNDWQIDIRSV